MANVLVHTGDESVTIPAQAVKKLLSAGNGDAALLYMALLRHHGTVMPRALAGELRWDRPRIESAELALRDMNGEPLTRENYGELMERIDAYLSEFDRHGTDNISVDMDE